MPYTPPNLNSNTTYNDILEVLNVSTAISANDSPIQRSFIFDYFKEDTPSSKSGAVDDFLGDNINANNSDRRLNLSNSASQSVNTTGLENHSTKDNSKKSRGKASKKSWPGWIRSLRENNEKHQSDACGSLSKVCCDASDKFQRRTFGSELVDGAVECQYSWKNNLHEETESYGSRWYVNLPTEEEYCSAGTYNENFRSYSDTTYGNENDDRIVTFLNDDSAIGAYDANHSQSKEFLPDSLYDRSHIHTIHAVNRVISTERDKEKRGKSLSMDHTLQRHFDFDTLRRKIGDRTSSEPTREMPPCFHTDSTEVNRENAPAEKRCSPRTTLSGPTISYTVQANDTLTSIAARFDTTPSELTKMNRLSTRFLFPGQILLVPDKGGAKENLEGPPEERDVLKDLNASSLTDLALPVSPYTAGLPRTPANSVDTERSLDRECLEKFLKIQVRHITDGQGVVAGVLLVTPNAVMFDPNVSDPLVIERGSECYGVIAPMDFVVNAALYYDIAHMKVKETGLPRPEIPKPEIYYGPLRLSQESEDNIECHALLQVGDQGGSQESPSKDLSLSKDATFPELATSSQDNDNDSQCSCGGETRETSAFPKAFEHEILTPISSDASPTGLETHLASPAPPIISSSVLGDLTPIAEAPKGDDITDVSGTAAQSVCDKSSVKLAQPMLTSEDGNNSLGSASSLSTANDKKRTTSVTFSTSSDSDMPTVPEDSTDQPSQESRKQKVLKRLSYPLSWMESFSTTDREGHSVNQHQQVPSSAPPTIVGVAGAAAAGAPPPLNAEHPDANRPGMFSNVFSMSNVSNMLTRRPSLDFARRPVSAESSVGLQPLSYMVSPFSNHQAEKRAQFKEGPKFGLKSMVSVDDRPDLFANFDKLIPKPTSCCDDPPLYLCLRMGKPIDKPIPKSTPIMTYGKKTMRPEYWFSIPRNRTDELFSFFQIWASDIYGELDEDAVRMKGFLVLEEETNIWPDDKNLEWEDVGALGTGELKEMTKESWEIASMSEELRRALYSSSSLSSLDIEVFLPEIQGATEIIDDAFRKSMYRKLPARVQGHNWKLVFSTSQNGFSLKGLYRKMAEIDSPIILYIQDTEQNKFGALLSCPLRVSELFYGTGESFLFVCQPEFQIFPWTGENTFFVKGNNESLYVGGGDGNFGIWLDGDLYQGRSQSCKTFGNPPLSSTEDFIIKNVECWHFD